jgi:hypothetical protein
MIILLTAALLWWVVIPLIGWGYITATLLGFYYACTYLDGSENAVGEKNRSFPWFKDRIAILVHWIGRYLFSYQVVYCSDTSTNKGEKERRLLQDRVRDIIGSGDGILCAHIHGLFALSSIFHLSSLNNYQRLRLAVHKNIFRIPFLRELVLWCGAISPTRENVKGCIERDSLYLVISGSRGMLDEEKQHRGALDIAYNAGKIIIPCRHEGQDKVFHCYKGSEWIDRLRLFSMNKSGYAFPTLFSMSLKSLTTYVYEPLIPSNYENADAFVAAYYDIVSPKNEMK